MLISYELDCVVGKRFSSLYLLCVFVSYLWGKKEFPTFFGAGVCVDGEKRPRRRSDVCVCGDEKSVCERREAHRPKN